MEEDVLMNPLEEEGEENQHFQPGQIEALSDWRWQKEQERPTLISAIREIKSPRYTPEEVDLLISKIVSVEQIKDDF